VDISSYGQYVAGVDEVGRGPLAGAVVTAAVILPEGDLPDFLKDSKKLSKKKREEVFEWIMAEAVAVGIGEASVAEIDKMNILRASLLAMSRAVYQLPIIPNMALIDGNHVPVDLPCPGRAIIKGDSRVKSIAAASIIAKVTRDRAMAELGVLYPEYGFEKHAGYGTRQHLDALETFGPILGQHRISFAPVKRLMLEPA